MMYLEMIKMHTSCEHVMVIINIQICLQYEISHQENCVLCKLVSIDIQILA